MSKPDQPVEKQSRENFSVIEQSINKYFIDIEHSVPRFQQELFDLQNEYYKTWKNVIQANVSLQKEFVNKTDVFNLPEPVQKMIESMNDEIQRAYSMRNQMYSVVIETTKKNIKTWNDNAKTFADHNKKIMQYWFSAFMPNDESQKNA